MMTDKKRYDATVARIAGNLLSGREPGTTEDLSYQDEQAVLWAVAMARAIVAEVERTEPTAKPENA